MFLLNVTSVWKLSLYTQNNVFKHERRDQRSRFSELVSMTDYQSKGFIWTMKLFPAPSVLRCYSVPYPTDNSHNKCGQVSVFILLIFSFNQRFVALWYCRTSVNAAVIHGMEGTSFTTFNLDDCHTEPHIYRHCRKCKLKWNN